MPQIFAFIAPLLGQLAIIGAELGLSTGLLTGLVSAVSYGIQAAVIGGLSLLANALFGPKAPPQPKPQERQQTLRESAHPAWRVVGREKMGGVLAYLAVVGDGLHRVIAHGRGPVDAVEEIWIDSTLVATNPGGDILTAPWAGGIGHVETRSGALAETHYASLTAATSGAWTPQHRGDGVVSSYSRFNRVAPENYSATYPGGEPLVRLVLRGERSWNPADPMQSLNAPAGWDWSENGVRNIVHYMRHEDGLRIPASFFTAAAEELKTEVLACDENRPLKAGGFEPRWRCSTSWSFDEQPASVLGRMMQAIDAKVFATRNRGLVVRAGGWRPPTVRLKDAITDVTVQRGRDIMSSANLIRAQYTSRLHDYQSIDADPLADEDDIVARGELAQSIEYFCSPSHPQTRALMKLALARANPKWSVTVTTDLRGMEITGEDTVILEIPEYGIDESFEIEGEPEWLLGENSVLMGLRFTAISMGPEAHAYDPLLDEGDAPVVPDAVLVENGTQPPVNALVAVEQRNINGVLNAAVAVITWNAPSDLSLRVEVRGKPVSGGESAWLPLPVAPGQNRTESQVLADGVEYQFEVRFVRMTGARSDWAVTTPPTVMAVADLVAPAPVTAVSATGAAGGATVQWTAPNDSHYRSARIWRNTVNNFATATLVRQVFGPPNATFASADTGLSAGTYYYFVQALNGSNVAPAGTPPGTGAVVVT